MTRTEYRLRKDRHGYCIRFKLIGDPPLYGRDAAQVCVAALQKAKFTGRCEYYEADDLRNGDFLVGLGLKQPDGSETPEWEWWQRFIGLVVVECDRLVPNGTLDPDDVHLQGIFVHRIVHVPEHENAFEYRTVRKR